MAVATMPQLTLIGSVNSPEFHRAAAIVNAAMATISTASAAVRNRVGTAEVTPLLPVDYEHQLERLRRELGSKAWNHSAGAAAYSTTGGFIGDDVALIAWLQRQGVHCSTPALPTHGTSKTWEQAANAAYSNFLVATGLLYVYMEFETDGKPLGKIVFELFSDRLPKTAANFEALCTGAKGQSGDKVQKSSISGASLMHTSTDNGTRLHYLDTPIHRIVRDGWIQGGDIVSGSGSSGVSTLDAPLPDECFAVKHDAAGILGMANTGPHSATSQFYVTTAPIPAFDRKKVAFGRVIDGSEVLKQIAMLATQNERPQVPLKVSGCGKLEPTEIATFDADSAASKMQAARRGQAARRQRQQQDEAALRVQAITRGRNARRVAQ